MKYYIIAGEASGDLHGSGLVRALLQSDDEAICRAWGGPLMEVAGAEVVKDYSELAFMGFAEVLKNIRTILGNFAFCKKDLLSFQPDVLILIDYPGFNLRMAKWAHQQGIRVFYYISPQLWAWNTRRVHGIKKYVDRMFVILPFEKAFYKTYDYDVDFVGHPLMDVIPGPLPSTEWQEEQGLDKRPVIALLPGSRAQEVRRMLQGMLTIAAYFQDYQFVVAAVSSLPPTVYEDLLAAAPQTNCKLVFNQTYKLLRIAKAALVTSGTATLETALFGVPQVVCYSGNPASYWLAKRLVKVDYISLVNLIVEKPLVTELIQEDFNTENLRQELSKLLEGKERAAMLAGYAELKEKLGKKGASARCAALIQKYLTQSS